MKSLSQFVKESFDGTKFMTTVFRDSADTGEVYDAFVGYIDIDTSLTCFSPLQSPDEIYFRLTTGSKFHDTTKRSWSKKYTIDTIPAKFANHAEELMQNMKNELLMKSIDADDDLKDFMSESLLGDFISNKESLITYIIDACKNSAGFLKKLLLTLDDAVDINESRVDEEFICERSWFSAIVTNLLLYAAAKQVAKIDTKWLRALLMGLIVAKVITSNDLGKKLQNFVGMNS